MEGIKAIFMLLETLKVSPDKNFILVWYQAMKIMISRHLESIRDLQISN